MSGTCVLGDQAPGLLRIAQSLGVEFFIVSVKLFSVALEMMLLLQLQLYPIQLFEVLVIVVQDFDHLIPQLSSVFWVISFTELALLHHMLAGGSSRKKHWCLRNQ